MFFWRVPKVAPGMSFSSLLVPLAILLAPFGSILVPKGSPLVPKGPQNDPLGVHFRGKLSHQDGQGSKVGPRPPKGQLLRAFWVHFDVFQVDFEYIWGYAGSNMGTLFFEYYCIPFEYLTCLFVDLRLKLHCCFQ